MSGLPVEWVIIVYYGSSAHRATYGRLGGTKYTKDYIQLYRTKPFLDSITKVFPTLSPNASPVPLTYKWPGGQTTGSLVFRSADRPHLKWETIHGAPAAWRMTPSPSPSTAETIPGDPTLVNDVLADGELGKLSKKGAGQPYLVGVKLKGEDGVLHLRTYLDNPSAAFSWAGTSFLPQDVKDLLPNLSAKKALAWSNFESQGVLPADEVLSVLWQLSSSDDPVKAIENLTPALASSIVDYLKDPARGLFFDPARSYDAWSQAPVLPPATEQKSAFLLGLLESNYSAQHQGDLYAEALDVSPEVVEAFNQQMQQNNYEVPDSLATVKVRGSAQKAFSDAVKKNYEYKCAVTGIETRSFLVASHIVPWSQDSTIRLDPANGICLSLLIDRAFENGYLVVNDDLTIRVDSDRIGSDAALRESLMPYDTKTIRAPLSHVPEASYLQRRRQLVGSED
ncbi:HNH endonuclease [Pseudomonas aeruginosa]|uniref:HNH endonuclease n=1 Tax=Pseudomonas aeruginosa TaxID=287 RepID=A0A643J217_PSEAI|nr:HNH endonuclease signature motif containing protein [Pseudomonas aeruginosa]EKV4465598.1 HNH endonuclease [Pseudomonas aeruginosa]ELQ7869184.1 HNH endonuclease [Pseudomonas aeruginosa]KAB0765515.1 HNH endonuclease [Pseudomonas aeruginosa]MBH8942216.1 HNH endonuclease [Pseudomonas aeruginosa]MCW5399197.1 HNH endonuclease [Pseudomonas aeruginosa]